MLVTKEAAVLNDIQNGTPGRSRSIGSAAWPSWIAISDDDAHQAESDDAGRVGPRALLGVGVHAAEAVDSTLDAQVSRAGVDPRHVVAERDVRRCQQGDEEGDRQQTAEGVGH